MKVSVVYYSRTGQTRRFIEKLSQEVPDLKMFEIKSGEEEFNKPYVLITPTYRFGGVPEEVEEFLNKEGNANSVVAVVSSGNKNWGIENYAVSGDKISKMLNIPLLHKFEMRGSESDVKQVKKELIKLNILEKDEKY